MFFIITEGEMINVVTIIELEKSPLGKHHGNN